MLNVCVDVGRPIGRSNESEPTNRSPISLRSGSRERLIPEEPAIYKSLPPTNLYVLSTSSAGILVPSVRDVLDSLCEEGERRDGGMRSPRRSIGMILPPCDRLGRIGSILPDSTTLPTTRVQYQGCFFRTSTNRKIVSSQTLPVRQN